MGYHDGILYGKMQEIIEDKLNIILLHEVNNLIKKNWVPDDEVIREGMEFLICLSTTVEVMKKLISQYLPDWLQMWSTNTISGNTTRLKQVNNIVKFIKKMEETKIGTTYKNAMIMPQIRVAIF